MKFGINEVEKIYFGTTELEKIYLGSTLVYNGSDTPEYEQKWSDDQPPQHNTPVPIDDIGLTVGITSMSVKKVYEMVNSSDSVGLNTGLVSVTVENL